MADEIVIVGAARTPMGALQGSLGSVRAPALGAVAIKAALERAKLTGEDVEEVIMGCVLPAGQGQAPARQAALTAGLPQSVGCTTVNKMCGSGMQAVKFAINQLRAGESKILIAGGMESMTQAPYLLPHARNGMRMGHGQVLDHMFLDGLEDAYDHVLMGVFAQRTADKFGVSREAMDRYAMLSLSRANEAIKQGWLKDEVAPVTVKHRKGETVVDTDEQPGQARPEKIPQLKPAFAKDGSVTAANSSSISDGASALVLMSGEVARQRQLTPLARVVAHSTHAQAPSEFPEAPIGAIHKVLEKTGWSLDEVDLFEINEAFAVVTMLAIDQLGLDESKVNIFGGACAQGHPIGSSGSRILVTLTNAMRQRGARKGIAAICIGGGEATAVAIERDI